jgi:hypothetical protein
MMDLTGLHFILLDLSQDLQGPPFELALTVGISGPGRSNVLMIRPARDKTSYQMCKTQ